METAPAYNQLSDLHLPPTTHPYELIFFTHACPPNACHDFLDQPDDGALAPKLHGHHSCADTADAAAAPADLCDAAPAAAVAADAPIPSDAAADDAPADQTHWFK